jgi:F-type H+-transporting ATPase subunit delta
MAVAQRIYAEALLAAAKEAGRLDGVRRELGEFVAALQASAELRDFLRNPQIEGRAKREVIEELLAGADDLFLNFVRLLAEKGRIEEIDAVFEELERLIAAEERLLELELVTAIELSDKEAKEIVEQIEQASGRRVEARRRVDPKLIGGLVVQAGSLRLDASVRGRLDRLREELTART